MQDITKCKATDCKKKENCFRYVASSYRYQSFADFSELCKTDSKYYWPIVEEKQVND